YNQMFGISYTNCLIGASDGSLAYDGTDSWRDLGGNVFGVDPKFAADKAATLGVESYSLRWGSPARGKGDASLLIGIDRDLVGNDRLRDGKLDLGCYACWLDPTGTWDPLPVGSTGVKIGSRWFPISKSRCQSLKV
ncbi:MAG: hypothetical protein Q4G65_15900, partial [bacterium]|nr:hypothetical protein [bacterium]